MSELLYTNKILADALGINLAKQQRHAREFLGIDPAAGQSSGVERKLTLEQAFIVYLCGVAVNKHNVPLKEAKELAFDLHSWLEKASYFPIFKHLQNRLNMDIDAHTGEDKTFLTELPKDEDYLSWKLLISKWSSDYVTKARGNLYVQVEGFEEILEELGVDNLFIFEEKITDVFIESSVSLHGRNSVGGPTINTATIYLDSEFLRFTEKLGLWTM